MWLEITRSNNNPHVVRKLFLDCIKEQQSCPTILRTDNGTENGIMAATQSFLRRNHPDVFSRVKAHQQVLITYKTRAHAQLFVTLLPQAVSQTFRHI